MILGAQGEHPDVTVVTRLERLKGIERSVKKSALLSETTDSLLPSLSSPPGTVMPGGLVPSCCMLAKP